MKHLNPIATQNISVLGYKRFTDDETLIILHNLSSKETTITLDELEGTQCIYTSNTAQSLSGSSLTLPANTTVIYKH